MKEILSSEKSVRFFKIFRIAVLCATGVAAVLRALSLLLFYDADIGYYQSGSLLPSVFTVLLAIFAVFAVVACIMFGKNSPSPEKYTVSSRCSAVFVALAFAVTAISSAFSLFSSTEYFMIYPSSFLIYFVTALTVIAPIAACAYFVLYALGRISPSFALAGGILALAYFVITLADSYFDIYVQMNAPEKLSTHLCCICAMLVILNDMRVMCEAEKKAFYLFSVSFSAIALNACALPTIIASFAGVFTDGTTVPPEPSSYVFFALGIFCIVRLIMLEPKKETEAIEEQKNDTSSEDKEQL
jgi:hypothetical protein